MLLFINTGFIQAVRRAVMRVTTKQLVDNRYRWATSQLHMIWKGYPCHSSVMVNAMIEMGDVQYSMLFNDGEVHVITGKNKNWTLN